LTWEIKIEFIIISIIVSAWLFGRFLNIYSESMPASAAAAATPALAPATIPSQDTPDIQTSRRSNQRASGSARFLEPRPPQRVVRRKNNEASLADSNSPNLAVSVRTDFAIQKDNQRCGPSIIGGCNLSSLLSHR
jgi:hypothetical protein